jgi:hypothetical protein
MQGFDQIAIIIGIAVAIATTLLLAKHVQTPTSVGGPCLGWLTELEKDT